MWGVHPSKGPITRAGSGRLAQMRFAATEGSTWLLGSELTIRPAAPTRYRKATALLMSGTPDQHANDKAAQCAPTEGRLLLRPP